MAALGKILQHLGLLVLPIAMALNLMDAFKADKMLVMAAGGFAVFWIGRIVEGYGGSVRK